MNGGGIYPIIGSHQSISGITVAERIKKTNEENSRKVVQFFNGSKFSYFRKKIPQEDINKILSYSKENMIHAFAHAPYTINLARDPLKKPDSLSGLHRDLKELSPAGISSVVHIGSHLNEYSIQSVCRTLSALNFNDSTGHPLLLENAAGDGTDLGVTWEELKILADNTNEHIGFCIDTQHLFATGQVDFKTVDGVNEFYKQVDRTIGLKRLKLFHLNDSKYNPEDPIASRKYCSKKDAHANISRGFIWGDKKEDLKGLKHLLMRGGELGIPFICETPPVEIKGKDGKKKITNIDPEIVYFFLMEGK